MNQDIINFQIDLPVNKKDLINLCSIINSSTVLPVLETILVAVDKDYVYFSATDLENYATLKIPIQGYRKDPYSFLIKASFLKRFITNAGYVNPVVNFSIDTKNKILEMSAGEFEYKYNFGKNDDEQSFPKAMQFDESDTHKGYFTIAAKEIIAVIKTALSFASTDDLRPAMTGIYLHEHAGNLMMVSTDAHKLYYKNIMPVPSRFKDAKCILLKKLATVSISAFKDGDINIQTNGTIIKFSNKTFEITSRLIDARYPDYQVVLPKDNKLTIQLKRKQLANFLNLAVVLVNQTTKQINFSVSSDNSISVEGANTYDWEESNFCFKIPFYNPSISFEPFNFSMNASFFRQIVNQLKDEYITISTSMISTKGITIDDQFLIMPLMNGNYN